MRKQARQCLFCQGFSKCVYKLIHSLIFEITDPLIKHAFFLPSEHPNQEPKIVSILNPWTHTLINKFVFVADTGHYWTDLTTDQLFLCSYKSFPNPLLKSSVVCFLILPPQSFSSFTLDLLTSFFKKLFSSPP